MIRTLLIDDHPAMRIGLSAVLRAEPGFSPVATVASADEGVAELARRDTDVAIVDYNLPEEDGLSACLRIKAMEGPPRVLVYSAYATAELALPALAAGADGLASKTAPAAEIFDVIRLVARGRRVMPPVPAELLSWAQARLDPAEGRLLSRLVGRVGDSQSDPGRDGTEDAALRRSILAKLRVGAGPLEL